MDNVLFLLNVLGGTIWTIRSMRLSCRCYFRNVRAAHIVSVVGTLHCGKDLLSVRMGFVMFVLLLAAWAICLEACQWGGVGLIWGWGMLMYLTCMLLDSYAGVRWGGVGVGWGMLTYLTCYISVGHSCSAGTHGSGKVGEEGKPLKKRTKQRVIFKIAVVRSRTYNTFQKKNYFEPMEKLGQCEHWF